MIFVQFLNANSQNAKDLQDAKGLSADLTRSVTDMVLSQQNEKSTVSYLEKVQKGDKGIVLGFLSGEEGLWQSAGNRARSISDSQFLLELKDIPVDHYLHEAAFYVEEAAYDLLKKQVDTTTSRISRQILSTQQTERDKQIELEVEIEGTREVQAAWFNFVRQVKEESTQRSTSYVP
jgi:hypothetical protein